MIHQQYFCVNLHYNQYDKSRMDIGEFDIEGEYPIDAVITWVDGDDPEHRRKRMEYVTGKRENLHIDVAGETRYRSVGEIAWCVASINRFAPWIRRIFIVTDNQNPHIEEFMNHNFGDCQIPIQIVDHKEIFEGYEQYLPTFNSLSIISMLWRIKEMSDHFICFNDDLFLIKPVQPADFFEGGRPIANGYWHLTWTARLLRFLRRKKNGHKTVTFRDFMMRAGEALHMNKFIRMVHTPHPLTRSSFAEIWFDKDFPGLLESNIQYRFRHKRQFSACALFYCYTIPRMLSVLTQRKNHYLYLSPGRKTLEEVKETLRQFDANEKALFCCINSLDLAGEGIIREIENWLNGRIGVSVPKR